MAASLRRQPRGRAAGLFRRPRSRRSRWSCGRCPGVRAAGGRNAQQAPGSCRRIPAGRRGHRSDAHLHTRSGQLRRSSLPFISSVTKELDRGTRPADAVVARVASARDPLDDIRAVVEALGTQLSEGSDDRADLVDVAVHRHVQAHWGQAKTSANPRGRVVTLVGVQAHADEHVLCGCWLPEGLERGLGTHIAGSTVIRSADRPAVGLTTARR